MCLVFCFVFFKVWEFSIIFISFWGSSIFFLQGDGVFEFPFGLLFCVPCDGFGHWFFLLWYFFFKKQFILWVCRGARGCFAFVNFECFLFYYFEVSESLIFLLVLSFCEFSKKIVWCFTRGMKLWSFQIFFLSFWGFLIIFFWCEGWGCFALVDFESFLFYYFEVPKFSIFLLVILWVFKKNCVFCFRILKIWNLQFSSCQFGGLQKNLCEVSQARKWDVWTLKVFCFRILKFGIFNFLLVILGIFNFLCEVSQGGRYLLFLWKFGRSFVLIFWSSEVFNFLLIILGVFNFFVWSFHKWGNRVCAFLHMNFESFLFSYFEILEVSIFFLSF